MNFDPRVFYPAPSGRFYNTSEPPPSPVESIAYDPSDLDPDTHLYSQGLDDNLGKPMNAPIDYDFKTDLDTIADADLDTNVPSQSDAEEESSPLLITLDLEPLAILPLSRRASFVRSPEPPSTIPMSPTTSPFSRHASYVKSPEPRASAPMSPISISEKSLSGVSLSAVQPGSPLLADRPLTAFSTISVSAVSEYPEWGKAESDAESNCTISTEFHPQMVTPRWQRLGHDIQTGHDDLSTRARVERLYAVSSPSGYNNTPRKTSWDDQQPTKGILSHSAQAASATVSVMNNTNWSLALGLRNAISLEGNIRQSRDSISEALAAQERLVLSKHPFAATTSLAITPNPTGSKLAPIIIPPPSTLSLPALVPSPASPLAVPMSTSRSDSELSIPWPLTPRPILASSMYNTHGQAVTATQTEPRHPRNGGHNRNLTTANAAASDPVASRMTEPPFSAPIVPSHHRLSFHDASHIAPVPTHTPSSPFTALRAATSKPRKVATITRARTNSRSNKNGTLSNPRPLSMALTTKLNRFECDKCCFLDWSDDDDPNAKKHAIKKFFSRSGKDQSSVHHHTHEHTHVHEHVVTHELREYHYRKLNPDNGDITKPMPTMTVNAAHRPLVPPAVNKRHSVISTIEPATIPRASNPVGERHLSSSSKLRFSTLPPMPNTPLTPLTAPTGHSSPQYILPPSELPARRRPHAPPPLDLSYTAYTAYEDSGSSAEEEELQTEEDEYDDEEEDDEDDEQPTPRAEVHDASVHAMATHPNPRSRASSTGALSARSSNSGSQVSVGSRYSRYSTGSFASQANATPKAKTTNTRPKSDRVESHAFRRSHHPKPSYHDTEDEDENLVLDTPFAPSTWGYERDGFRMPIA